MTKTDSMQDNDQPRGTSFDPKAAGSQNKTDGPLDKLESMLSRPTTDVIEEAGFVASFAVEESKTVGGFGFMLLTFFALIATSPWSWIAALVFGPVRVWNFFLNAVSQGLETALGIVLFCLLTLGLLTVILTGWLILRVLT